MTAFRDYTILQTLPELKQEVRSKKYQKPELLAPAGDFDSLKTAVENGADAVYVGLKEFNARRQARNFTLKELYEAVCYAHLRNRKIYLAVNILIKERELRKVLDYVEKALTSGIDGLIVQDLGLASILSRLYEGVRLHASTQINCHNTATALFLENSGFTRIVLARETTLEEVRRIKNETGVEIEIFGHGALCFSYSGQCLLSSLVGRRSGNRGLCTQPCRLPYHLVVDKEGNRLEPEMLGNYPISTKDLCVLTHLPEIIKAGIDALKIEGRLKSAEYIGVVTRVYRREIDRAFLNSFGYQPLRESVEQLEEVFSRGFSSAYLTGIRDNQMMSYTRPSNRGAFIGRVVFVDNYSGRVGVLLRRNISKGDILEFWVSKGGRVSQEVKTIFLEGKEVEEVSKNRRAEIVVDKNRHLIKPGDRVHRVFNYKLNREAGNIFKEENRPRIPVKIFIKVIKGEPVSALAFSDDVEVEINTEIYPEISLRKQLTVEGIKKQIEKLKNTPYELTSFEALVDESVFLSLKQLNQIRRELISKLDEARLKSKKPDYIKKYGIDKVLSDVQVKREILNPILTVKAADCETAKVSLEAGADIVYLKLPSYRGQEEKSEKKIFTLRSIASLKGKWLGVSIPNIVKDSEVDFYIKFLTKYQHVFDVVLVDNPGFLTEAQKIHHNIVGDYHLNIFNAKALTALNEDKIRRFTLSVELSEREIEDILIKISLPLELIIYGDIEVMTAEHCPLLAISSSKITNERMDLPGCLLAERDNNPPAFCELGMAYLKDEKGYEFPVMTDMFCRGHIFNSRVLCAPFVIPKMRLLGVNYFRLELLLKRSEKEIKTTVKNYRKLLDAISAGRNEVAEKLMKNVCFRNFTTGHYQRGVL